MNMIEEMVLDCNDISDLENLKGYIRRMNDYEKK